MKVNLIATVDKHLLQKYLDESNTLKEIIHKIGVKMTVVQGSRYRMLHKRIAKDSLDTSQFEINNKKWVQENLKTLGLHSSLSDEEVFVVDSKLDRGGIKKRLLKSGVEYCCVLCGVDKWRDMELTLHLDHINGVNNDNRKENLRFLCPNCHEQETNNFRKSKRSGRCVVCQEPVTKGIKTCDNCRAGHLSLVHSHSRQGTRKFDPTKEELEKFLQDCDFNWVVAGKHYGVADNSIKKRCRLLNISFVTRPYRKFNT